MQNSMQQICSNSWAAPLKPSWCCDAYGTSWHVGSRAGRHIGGLKCCLDVVCGVWASLEMMHTQCATTPCTAADRVLHVLLLVLQGSVLSDLDDLRSSMSGGSSWFGFGTAMGPDRCAATPTNSVCTCFSVHASPMPLQACIGAARWAVTA